MFEVDCSLSAALAALLLMAAACDDAVEVSGGTDSGVHEERATSPAVRWVGVVEETDVRVAAIVGAGKARLFFCGGAASYLTATRWFEIAFNSEHLEYKDDAWRIHAHLTGDGVVGEVERAGDGVRTFNAHGFERATIAGLYEGRAECGHLGVIVTQPTKNDEPIALGACVAASGDPSQQVDAITPIALQNGKITVRTPGSGAGTLMLGAATLQPL